MKTIFFLSLVLLLAVSTASSQFGINGGVNFGTIGGDDKASIYNVAPKTKIGFTGGVSYTIGLLEGLAIEPEVMYIQKGALYESSGGDAYGMSWNEKTTFSDDYIDIPILVKYYLPTPAVNPYIEGGVSYGILLSAKNKYEKDSMGINYQPGVGAYGSTSVSKETDIKDLLVKNDLSVVVGMGVEIYILDINARYTIGLTKL